MANAIIGGHIYDTDHGENGDRLEQQLPPA
jgi:hypothetical protein